MEKESFTIILASCILASGMRTANMGRECISIILAIGIMDNGDLMRKMGEEHFIMQMVRSILVNRKKDHLLMLFLIFFRKFLEK